MMTKDSNSFTYEVHILEDAPSRPLFPCSGDDI